VPPEKLATLSFANLVASGPTGGAAKTRKPTATADGSLISTKNYKSPKRCVVTLTSSGPTTPQAAPLDGTNDTTELVIDVLNKNP